MKIIISPAKKMIKDTDSFMYEKLPVFLNKTKKLLTYLNGLSIKELKDVLNCNDKLLKENYLRYQTMDLRKDLTMAIIAYSGIQYQYMAPNVFEDKEFEYVKNHVRILSGFYGVLKPSDGISLYRLEMQAAINYNGITNLYDYWGKDLYDEVIDKSRTIINLASKEYARAIEPYISSKDKYINIVFGELINNKIVQKGVYVKMARGEMVRWLAKNNIKEIEAIKGFKGLGYNYDEELSSLNEFVFIKK